MKKYVATLMAVLGFSTLLFGQQETLLGDAQFVGGFGGPIFEWSTVNDDTGPTFGGGGGIILDDFFIGGFGQGGAFSEYRSALGGQDIGFGYGGLWIGYTYPSLQVVHIYTSLKIAGGGVVLSDFDRGFDFDFINDVDAFFAVIPEAGVEINLVEWFRLTPTVGYRWTEGVNRLGNLSDEDFRSVVFGLTLRFGGFGHGKR